MKKNVIKNIIMLYGYSIAKIVFPLITLPYLTRVLSVDMYGMVSYVKTLRTYMQLIVDFGFLLSGTRDIVKARDDKKKLGEVAGDIFLARLILVAGAFVLIVVLANVIPILQNFKLYTYISFIPVALTIFLFDYIFRGIEKMEIISSRFIITKTISTAFTFVFIRSDADVLWIPILDIIGTLVAIALVIIELKKQGIVIKITALSNAWKKLKESAIYFLSNIASTAFNALNTLLIGFFLMPSDVAYWSICIMLISTIQALYSPITDGVYPDMVKTKSLSQIKKMLLIFMPIVLAGCIFSFFVAKYVLLIIGGAKYVEATTLFRCLIPVLFFSFPAMLVGWPTLGAIDKAAEVTFTTIFSAAFQVAGLVVLGLSGNFTLINIAILRCITEVILLGSRSFFVRKYNSLFVH